MMDTLLITSMFISAFANVIPLIMKYIMAWIYTENKNEKALKSDLYKMECEMSRISMVDEFSKYTKIQRKHTKLKEDYKKQFSNRMSSRTKAQLFFTYLLKILNALIVMMLVKLYREQPIIILPEGTLWPINNILSWPGTYQNSISLLLWLGITSLAIPHLFSNITCM